jgi:ADP-heptose:LPS heptosyltransferase
VNNSSGKVIVVSLHLLGDSVFTIPAIKCLEEKYKDRLVLICYPESEQIFREVFKNICIKTIPKDDFFMGRIALPRARKIIRQLRPVYVFDLTGITASATLLTGIIANEIIGFNKIYFRDVYTKYIPARKTPHLIDMYLDVVGLDGIVCSESTKEFSCEVIQEGKILLNHSAGWPAKQWDFKKFIGLAVRLKKQYQVAFIARPDDIPGRMLCMLQKEGIELLNSSSIEKLIKEIRNCSVFIGNDSGPVYIAAMLGKPTFAIYGPTNPDFSKPFGVNHIFVKKEICCSPRAEKQYCEKDAGRKGCNDYLCMDLIEIDEVCIKLLNFLEKLKIQKLKP